MSDYCSDFSYDFERWPRRRPSPYHMYATDREGFLMAGVAGGGFRRSRSTGHGPAPNINVYNHVEHDGSFLPYPPYQYPVSPSSRKASPRASPEGRGRGKSRLGNRLGDELAEELAEIALEHRFRSRSRGRSFAPAFDRPSQMRGGYLNDVAEWQLAQHEALLRELLRESRRKEDEENIRRRIQLEQVEAEAKRERDEAERKKHDDELLADAKRKEAEAIANNRAAEREWETKKAEAERKRKEEEQAFREKLEREAKEKKEKEEKAHEEFKRRETEAAEEEKRKSEEYERKRKEREEQEKKRKQEEDKAFDEKMRERLRASGIPTEEMIDAMVDKDKSKNFQPEVILYSGPHTTINEPRAPRLPRVSRIYLTTEPAKKEKRELAFCRRRSRSRHGPKQEIFVTPLLRRAG